MGVGRAVSSGYLCSISVLKYFYIVVTKMLNGFGIKLLKTHYF